MCGQISLLNALIFLNSSEYELWSRQVLLQINELFQVVQKLLQYFDLELPYNLCLIIYIISNYKKKKKKLYLDALYSDFQFSICLFTVEKASFPEVVTMLDNILMQVSINKVLGEINMHLKFKMKGGLQDFSFLKAT